MLLRAHGVARRLTSNLMSLDALPLCGKVKVFWGAPWYLRTAMKGPDLLTVQP